MKCTETQTPNVDTYTIALVDADGVEFKFSSSQTPPSDFYVNSNTLEVSTASENSILGKACEGYVLKGDRLTSRILFKDCMVSLDDHNREKRCLEKAKEMMDRKPVETKFLKIALEVEKCDFENFHGCAFSQSRKLASFAPWKKKPKLSTFAKENFLRCLEKDIAITGKINLLACGG
jgi:hypothetical protein